MVDADVTDYIFKNAISRFQHPLEFVPLFCSNNDKLFNQRKPVSHHYMKIMKFVEFSLHMLTTLKVCYTDSPPVNRISEPFHANLYNQTEMVMFKLDWQPDRMYGIYYIFVLLFRYRLSIKKFTPTEKKTLQATD